MSHIRDIASYVVSWKLAGGLLFGCRSNLLKRKNFPWDVGLFGLAKNKTNPNQPELEMKLSLAIMPILLA